MLRAPIILSRRNETFSQMSIKNLGHLGRGKRGDILKIRFSTGKLPLLNMQVLINHYIRTVGKCAFIIFWSNTKWIQKWSCALEKQYYTVLGRQTVYHTQLYWYCHKTCCFLLLTCNSFMTLPYQANARFISTSTRTKPKMTNAGLANRQCRIRTNCIIAITQMKTLQNKYVGHVGIP